MKINIEYELDRCNVNISPDAVLTEVAFAVEAVASHFFGRGVSRFECNRLKNPDGSCTLLAKALSKSGPMVVSKVMSLGNAVRQGYFPLVLRQQDDFKLVEGSPYEKIVAEGQHRFAGLGTSASLLGRKKDGLTSTIIQSADMDPNQPLSTLTYGLGDLFTGLYALGVEQIKWQGSLKKTQLYFLHNLTNEQIAGYFASNIDYDIRRKVQTL